MSVEVMTLAWYVEGITPAQKAVLVALADHADDHGRRAYPGVARLVVKTSYAERTVRRALSDLRDMGLIKVQKEATQHSATWYYLDLPQMHLRANQEYTRPARNAPLENPDLPESPPDLPENTARPATNAPDPSLNHQEPSLIDDLPESTPLPELLRHFTAISGYFPPNNSTPNFETQWRGPLLAIYDRAGGNMSRTKEVMTDAHKALISGELGKVYRISSPQSIQVTAVNMLNGATQEPPPDMALVKAWREVKRAASNGNAPRFSSDRILEAVSPIWPEVKNMTAKTEREVRIKFERNYHAVT